MDWLAAVIICTCCCCMLSIHSFTLTVSVLLVCLIFWDYVQTVGSRWMEHDWVWI